LDGPQATRLDEPSWKHFYTVRSRINVSMVLTRSALDVW
jgi:hypothetical protein